MGQFRDRAMPAAALAGVATVMLSAAPAGAQDSDSITSDVLVLPEVVYTQNREGWVNPDGILEPADWEIESALVLEGQAFQWDYRLRGALGQERADGTWSSTDSTNVMELARSWDVTEGTVLRVGKTTVPWDVGRVFQPVGFFEEPLSLVGLEDRRRENEGFPLVELSYLGSTWDLAAVISSDFENDEGEDRGLDQWAVQARTFLGQTELFVVSRQVSGQRPGLGGGASRGFGLGTQVWFSAYAEPGNRRKVHEDVLDGDVQAGPYVPDDNPVQRYRKDNKTYYPRAVLGAERTWLSGLTVSGELIHDSRGLSSSEWDTFEELADQHRGISDDDLRAYNLGEDADMFRHGGARQNYLSLRADRSFGPWTPQGSAFISLDDGSASLNTRLSYNGGSALHVWGDIRANLGPADSEYAEVPEAGFVSVAAQVIF